MRCPRMATRRSSSMMRFSRSASASVNRPLGPRYSAARSRRSSTASISTRFATSEFSRSRKRPPAYHVPTRMLRASPMLIVREVAREIAELVSVNLHHLRSTEARRLASSREWVLPPPVSEPVGFPAWLRCPHSDQIPPTTGSLPELSQHRE